MSLSLSVLTLSLCLSLSLFLSSSPHVGDISCTVRAKGFLLTTHPSFVSNDAKTHTPTLQSHHQLYSMTHFQRKKKKKKKTVPVNVQICGTTTGSPYSTVCCRESRRAGEGNRCAFIVFSLSCLSFFPWRRRRPGHWEL